MDTTKLSLFKPARLEDVIGCAGYTGPAKTIEEMDAAIAAELNAMNVTRDSSHEPRPIDGRPRFAKRSINDGEKVKIAAIDPDFV